MDSLEWRTKQLENKLPGQVDIEQLIQAAKLYGAFLEANGDKYARFRELYEKHRNAAYHDQTNGQVGESIKAELVLAYEYDLVRHLENVKILAEKAESVLDVSKWPDVSGFQKRLDKLETVTRDQHLQSVTLDSRTEELIEIYNDIINSFKRNTILWNEKLGAYENEERKLDEDV